MAATVVDVDGRDVDDVEPVDLLVLVVVDVGFEDVDEGCAVAVVAGIRAFAAVVGTDGTVGPGDVAGTALVGA